MSAGRRRSCARREGRGVAFLFNSGKKISLADVKYVAWLLPPSQPSHAWSLVFPNLAGWVFLAEEHYKQLLYVLSVRSNNCAAVVNICGGS